MKEVTLHMREMKLTIHMERMVNKNMIFHLHAKNLELAVAPHKNVQQIRSIKHGLDQGITTIIAPQDRRFERQLQENRERENKF